MSEIGNVTTAGSGFFKTTHMSNVPHAKDGGQPLFTALRKENPAPLSLGAQKLAEFRGLQDPILANKKTEAHAHA